MKAGHTGVLAWQMLLSAQSSRWPQPSRIQRTTGRGRGEGGAIGSLYRGNGSSAEGGGRSVSGVGVAREDLLSAVKLLPPQESSQQMRPSHGAERQGESGALDHGLGKTIGAADHECESLCAVR